MTRWLLAPLRWWARLAPEDHLIVGLVAVYVLFVCWVVYLVGDGLAPPVGYL